MTQCTCGSTSFWLEETTLYKAFYINEESVLTAHTVRESVVNSITCRDCDTNYDEADFSEISFS